MASHQTATKSRIAFYHISLTWYQTPYITHYTIKHQIISQIKHHRSGRCQWRQYVKKKTGKTVFSTHFSGCISRGELEMRCSVARSNCYFCESFPLQLTVHTAPEIEDFTTSQDFAKAPNSCSILRKLGMSADRGNFFGPTESCSVVKTSTPGPV